jgi:hypothetical protein
MFHAIPNALDRRRLLDEPQLPSAEALEQWWPEPEREKFSILVPFGARPREASGALGTRREVPPANRSSDMQSFLPRPMTSFVRPASMRHIASEPSLDYRRPSISAPAQQQPSPEAEALGFGLPHKESPKAGTLGLGLQLTPLQTMLIARDSTRCLLNQERSLVNQERSLVKSASTRTTNGDLSSRPATGLSASASSPRIRPPAPLGGHPSGPRPRERGAGSGAVGKGSGAVGKGSGAVAARGPRTHPNPLEDRAVLGGPRTHPNPLEDRAVLGGSGGGGREGGGGEGGGGGGGGEGGILSLWQNQAPRQANSPSTAPQVPRQANSPSTAPQVPRQANSPSTAPQVPRQANSPSTAPSTKLLPRPLLVGGRDPSRSEDALGQVETHAMTSDDL